MLSIFTKKITKFNSNTYFFYITVSKSIKTNIVENISKLSQNINSDISLKRLDQGPKSIQIT